MNYSQDIFYYQHITSKRIYFDQTMQILYVSFKHLYYYESNTSLIEQKDEMNAKYCKSWDGNNTK
jgi:hypothetical protein